MYCVFIKKFYDMHRAFRCKNIAFGGILENNEIKMLQKQMIFNKFIRNILWNLREFQRIISPLDAGSFS